MRFSGGRLALPGRRDFVEADFEVEDGRIAAIHEHGATGPATMAGGPGSGGPNPGAVRHGEPAVSLEGMLVFPGAIDPHVHFDEPGFTHREDFAHGSAEAARGGVTTVIDMPCTSLPPVTTRAALERKLGVVSGRAIVDFAFFGGVSGHTAAESLSRHMAELSPLVAGFKCYFISGMDTFTAVDPGVFGAAAAEASRLGRPLLLHAEDPGVIGQAAGALASRRDAAARQPTWRDYYASRPPEAEIEAVRTALAASGKHSRAVHIVHVGTSRAVELVAAARRAGGGDGPTCETCPHYLAFDETDFDRIGASLKTAPPVKTADEKALLWHGLATGSIDFVASDHAPAPSDEKETGNPLTAYGGIPGTGTLFPYLLSEGLFAGRLDLATFLRVTSSGAARRYGLAGRKGELAPGQDADFVVVDPGGRTTVRGGDLYSKGALTPFEGMTLHGRILATFVRGTAVYCDGFDGGERGLRVEPGYGRFLTWGKQWAQ